MSERKLQTSMFLEDQNIATPNTCRKQSTDNQNCFKIITHAKTIKSRNICGSVTAYVYISPSITESYTIIRA